MLIRISLIIAIIAGLATAGLSFLKVKEKITTLQSDLQTQTEGRQKAERELAATRNDLDKTKKDLDTTKATLATTTTERDKALADADTQRKHVASLTENLSKVQQERDEAQAELAQWKVLGVTPDQIKALIAQNKQLEADRSNLEVKLADLTREYRRTVNELARFKPGWEPPLLPPGLRGKVLVVDPKWDFVVVDVGEKQGVVEDGRLLVSRNGKLVAQVAVRSVSPDRSIANVLPGWKLGEILEGDQVLPPELQ